MRRSQMNFLKNLMIGFLTMSLIITIGIIFIQALDKTMDNQEKAAKKYVNQLDPEVVKNLKK